MKTKPSVLVVGGSGFIGRYTIRRLSDDGWTVRATCLPHESPGDVANVEWLPCDISSPSATSSWPASCDAVIYLAQYPGWKDFPEKAFATFDVNVGGVARTVEYARLANIRNFLFTSTGSVYNQVNRPARESDLFDLNTGIDHYVATKLSAELLLRSYSSLFAVQILRIFVPYGLGQHPHMLLPQLVRRVQEGRKIDLYGEDGMRINPVAVADVAEAITRCLRLEESLTLNVAGPEILSLRDVGNSIGRVLGLTPLFEHHAEQPIRALIGDTSLLKRCLGWTPSILLESGLHSWLSAK